MEASKAACESGCQHAGAGAGDFTVALGRLQTLLEALPAAHKNGRMDSAYAGLMENLHAVVAAVPGPNGGQPVSDGASSAAGRRSCRELALPDDVYPDDWPDPAAAAIDDETVDGYSNVAGLAPAVAREHIREYFATVVRDIKRARTQA